MPLPEDKVHSNYYWIVEGEEFVGYLALRQALTPWLLEKGGHIGFSVRLARRREGHARRALALALVEARAWAWTGGCSPAMRTTTGHG